MSRRVRPSRFEQLERAGEVRLEVGAGIVDRVAHPRLSREVDDHVGTLAGEEVAQQAGILQPGLHGSEPGMLRQHGVAPLFQRDVVIVGHCVEAGDARALVQKPFRKVVADEAG